MSLPSVNASWGQLFGESYGSETYLQFTDWEYPVTYFVGRNGSGKSRCARVIADAIQAKMLSTDRLLGLMNVDHYGWTMTLNMLNYKGVPIDQSQRQQAREFSQRVGSAIDEIYALREEPDVWLKVAAFVKRSLGRTIELREAAGYIDPYVRIGSREYSLLRDEGHGLRELVVLLAATYRQDWQILIIDEPELHLHPSMARLLLGELKRICSETGKRAIVITHEPALIQPKSSDELGSLWHFALGREPIRLLDKLPPGSHGKITSHLLRNPSLVSDLVFSPQPVLVEGMHDVAALSTSLQRTKPSEVVAQTDFVDCGGYGGVATWFEIASSLALNVRAIADLDALFSSECRRAMDYRPSAVQKYRERFKIEPPSTSAVLKPLTDAMGLAKIPGQPNTRRDWLKELSNDPPSGLAMRRDEILDIWRSEGLWLHPQGTLEGVLGISEKSSENARNAAMEPGPIDDVSAWSSYTLDTSGDVKNLLGVAVEGIAHRVMEALRMSPAEEFNAPVGASALTDSKLVDVIPLSNGQHRIVVKRPSEFEGWWLEFSRGTPASDLELSPPSD